MSQKLWWSHYGTVSLWSKSQKYKVKKLGISETMTLLYVIQTVIPVWQKMPKGVEDGGGGTKALCLFQNKEKSSNITTYVGVLCIWLGKKLNAGNEQILKSCPDFSCLLFLCRTCCYQLFVSTERYSINIPKSLSHVLAFQYK